MDRRISSSSIVVLALLAASSHACEPPQSSLSIEDYARFAKTAKGDSDRGRELYNDPKRLACTKCHKVLGAGGEVGPDLTNIAGKFPRDVIIESVLEPSKQIVEGYRTQVVVTKEGLVLTGIVKEQSADELILVDAEGQRRRIQKQNIEESKTSGLSLMPVSLASGISKQDFADLIAYLETFRPADQGTPGAGNAGTLHRPEGFSVETVASGITGVTAMEIASEGRVFVCEQTGRLRIVKDGALLPEPFVKLEVDSSWERGLLGIALDPHFDKNHFIYLNYVSKDPHPHHKISRFTATGDNAAPDSEFVLLEGDDQRKLGGNRQDGHQGGAIHFGKDGKLLIAIGDQTAGEPAQRLDTFQGKLLRINPDGSIPEDNPFFTKAKGKYRAIWALGLRNPFTFAVQSESGRIFANDVGETRWEEVDEAFAGGELRLARLRRTHLRSQVPWAYPSLPRRFGDRRSLLPQEGRSQLSQRVPGKVFLHGFRQGLDPHARS